MPLLQKNCSETSEFTRYCPDCKNRVIPSVGESSDENYHSEDVSPVRCADCGNGLGHLVWWPHE